MNFSENRGKCKTVGKNYFKVYVNFNIKNLPLKPMKVFATDRIHGYISNICNTTYNHNGKLQGKLITKTITFNFEP